ncbi:hypothetical protein [Sideroxyarcus sp. TK5]
MRQLLHDYYTSHSGVTLIQAALDGFFRGLTEVGFAVTIADLKTSEE